MIYILGGVSRSGKSSIRKALLASGISGIDTDTIRTMIGDVDKHLGISHERPPRENAEKLFPYIKALVRARSFFVEDFLIEGDAILPRLVAEYQSDPTVRSLFLIYPSLSVSAKMDELAKYPEGWSAHVDKGLLHEMVQGFIDDSKLIMQECETLHLPYLDVSTLSFEEMVKKGKVLLLGR